MAKRRRSRSRSNKGTPGWIWMLGGFALGLSVALAVYLVDRQPQVVETPQARPEPLSQRDEPVPAEEPGFDFDFYEMLPKFEVIIPETDQDPRPDASPAAVEEPGSYVLQAGSFSSFADADRMRANLALLGVESRIQKVTIDDATFHRVRVGPIDDLRRLNDIRGRLREARVEVMVIRLPAG